MMGNSFGTDDQAVSLTDLVADVHCSVCDYMGTAFRKLKAIPVPLAEDMRAVMAMTEDVPLPTETRKIVEFWQLILEHCGPDPDSYRGPTSVRAQEICIRGFLTLSGVTATQTGKDLLALRRLIVKRHGLAEFASSTVPVTSIPWKQLPNGNRRKRRAPKAPAGERVTVVGDGEGLHGNVRDYWPITGSR